MAVRTIHLCLDIRGYLHKSNRELHNVFKREDGSYASAHEAREFLMDRLAAGDKFLPLSAECDGFDPQNGCPGHEKTG
jgi:hypothetical protein